jgi:peptidoglycan/LPS O-acetylase OafA/YrhL
MVFIVHLGQRVNLNGFLRKLTDIGAYGPMLFFLISGFLAARRLCGENTPPLNIIKNEL